MRIGLIDDERIILDLLDEFLGELGHDVVCAESGERFLTKTARHDPRFDLIITDFRMPGISGTSLIRELRHRFPNASIVVISGFPEMLFSDDDRSGVCAFLDKPIRFGELEFLLTRLAENRPAADDEPGD